MLNHSEKDIKTIINCFCDFHYSMSHCGVVVKNKYIHRLENMEDFLSIFTILFYMDNYREFLDYFEKNLWVAISIKYPKHNRTRFKLKKLKKEMEIGFTPTLRRGMGYFVNDKHVNEKNITVVKNAVKGLIIPNCIINTIISFCPLNPKKFKITSCPCLILEVFTESKKRPRDMDSIHLDPKIKHPSPEHTVDIWFRFFYGYFTSTMDYPHEKFTVIEPIRF